MSEWRMRDGLVSRRQQADDREWADSFFADIERIFARSAIRLISLRQASTQEDMRQATDYHGVTELGPLAARIRRDDISFRDLTLRFRRRAPDGRWRRGYEADKILEGFARLYLYVWVKR